MEDLSWIHEAIKYGLITIPEAIAFIAYMTKIRKRKKNLEKESRER